MTDPISIEGIFGERATTAIIQEIEAALAQAQASLGIIPKDAADKIRAKAHPDYVPAQDVAAMRTTVGHPLVSLLRVWSEALGEDAAAWLHYGATTPDIRLTTQIIQMRRAIEYFCALGVTVESLLMELARTYRDTPMQGRTVGRHALPITFGLKATTWMLENRRNLERMKGWLARTDTGVLGGAVGTYAALGVQGFEVEALTMDILNLGAPEPADWKGTRDKHAEWGSLLAISAKSYARMAQEIFLLQGDDFAELDEDNEEVGSSTMPHKANPRRATAIIAIAREIAHESGVLLDWMVSIFERDQIPNDRILSSIATKMEELLLNAVGLLERLRVYPENMKRNLHRTDSMIMAERIMFALGDHVGKHKAHEMVHAAARTAMQEKISFRTALLRDEAIAACVDEKTLDTLLDPLTYTGLAAQAVDRALMQIEAARRADAA